MPEMARPEPSRLYRWIVLIMIGMVMFGNYYIYDCIAPIADLLSKQLGFSDSNIGLLQAIYSIPNVIMVLVGGYIVDRIGTRKAILIFGTICFIGSAITVLSGKLLTFSVNLWPVHETFSAPVMAGGRLIFGLGAESLLVAVGTTIAKWFRGKELGFACGINLMIARSGSWLAQNSPTWAKFAYSNWRTPLLVAMAFGSFCVTGAIVYWALEVYAEKHFELGHGRSSEKVAFSDLYKFGVSYWYIVALCIVFYSAILPFETFAIKFFIEAHGTSRELGGFLLSMLTAFAMFGTPVFGLFADKIGRRALLMMLASLLLIPVYLMMAYTGISLYVPMAMMGIAFSLIPAVMWPSVAYIVEQNKLGTAYGLMAMMQNIGLAGFNLMIGWANDHSHASVQNPAGYRTGLWMLSVLGFLGFLFAFLLRQRELGSYGHGLETITAKEG
jgi:MFS family permease